MPTAASRKGKQFELDVVRALPGAVRPRQEGFQDKGDVHYAGLFALQCKNYANVSDALRVGVPAAELQAGHAGLKYGVAVIKARNKNVDDAYVCMPLRAFRRLVEEEVK